MVLSLKSVDHIEAQIYSLENKLNQMKEALEQVRHNQQTKFIITPYFSYTTISSKNSGHILLLVSFIIHNVNETNPYICIKFSPNVINSFSAKIGSKEVADQDFNPDAFETWHYINDEAKERVHDCEYWLQPLAIQQLEQEQELIFNFQVTLPSIQNFKIEGYLYGDELKDGIESLNKIRLIG